MLHNIVIINDFCFVKGGASRVAIDEALALVARGYHVHFFGAVGPVGPELTDVQNLTVTCLDQPELADVGKNPFVAWQGLWNTKALHALCDVLRAYDPAQTVVHLHGYSKALTASVVKAASKLHFSMIYTLHDYFAVCPNGGFFDYRHQKICMLPGVCFSCLALNCDKRNYLHKLYRFLRAVLHRFLADWPAALRHLIYLSEISLTRVEKTIPQTCKRYRLDNINETPKQEKVDLNSNSNFIFVGQLDPHKGIYQLINAAKRVGVKPLFIGEGPLRQEIEKAGFIVTGWLSRAAVDQQIEKARCVIFPSLWHETYGLVVDEAMSRGVPVIASDVTAAAERIVDGQSGWICRAADINDLARCLSAANNTEQAIRCGQAAYDTFWAAPPTRQTHTSKLLQIYHCILQERSENLGTASR